MIRPPFMARVAAGVAVTAYEETLRLPSTAVALPMTTVSQILQTAMRMQQVMTSLAIKGDQLFELFGSEPSEKPEWAVFDEDEEPVTSDDAPKKRADTPAPASGRFALYSVPPGETAGKPSTTSTVTESPVTTAASSEPAAKAPATTKTTPAKKTAAKKAPAKKAAATQGSATKSTVTKTSPARKSAAKKPAVKAASQPSEIAEYLDYDSLTLAQLRARLRTLSVEDLTALLTYENANAGRAPFVTMLSNRISTAERK